MSDPPLSGIDLKNKMAWVWTTLKFFGSTKYRPNPTPPIVQTHFLILIKFCELRMLLIFYSCPFELELENVCRLKHRSFALYPLL